MTEKTKSTLKNILALIGVAAAAKTAPELSAGIAIGIVITNPEDVKKAAKDFVSKCAEIKDKVEKNTKTDPDFGNLDDFDELEYDDEFDDRYESDEAEIVCTKEEVAGAFDEEIPEEKNIAE